MTLVQLRRLRVILCSAFAALLLLGALIAEAGEWRVAMSGDGTPVAYTVAGNGAVTLVFVHGWSCDTRYWRQQIDHFSAKYRVVSLDLAGHGHSGLGRATYTMQAFGGDVKAVVDAVGAERVILIGHSMGGVIVAEAASLLPGKVIGVIGIDTLQNVEQVFPQQQVDGFIASFQKDFPGTARPFVKTMLVKETAPELAQWVTEDMAAAPPAVAISAFREMTGMYMRGDVPRLFDELTVPVRCINADLEPTNIEANRRHMRSFDVKVMKGRGHFLMLERPAEFNRLLDATVQELVARK